MLLFGFISGIVVSLASMYFGIVHKQQPKQIGNEEVKPVKVLSGNPYRENFSPVRILEPTDPIDTLHDRIAELKIKLEMLQQQHKQLLDMLRYPEKYGREACINGIRTDILSHLKIDYLADMGKYKTAWGHKVMRPGEARGWTKKWNPISRNFYWELSDNIKTMLKQLAG